ncbi:hypothetical protein DACRYDRAFT_107071 [Dacryopinax primogenitus]|uniref:Uncharacterized protein n=1 Tax=Dacryopinax primogenitus (strain DJM 731) TaxID=1858805 RepID=M5G054_DACPD|nr:uncharacterized protein DACRYDRAFT_107071 [Dacryopinax primogenitus]EJU02134.1 hypothetical protein DACRYDRAFT_107071 [Dacryopinax primogenitus]
MSQPTGNQPPSCGSGCSRAIHMHSSSLNVGSPGSPDSASTNLAAPHGTQQPLSVSPGHAVTQGSGE